MSTIEERAWETARQTQQMHRRFHRDDTEELQFFANRLTTFAASELARAKVPEMREALEEAQRQMVEAANSMTLRGMPVHAQKLDNIIERIDALSQPTEARHETE